MTDAMAVGDPNGGVGGLVDQAFDPLPGPLAPPTPSLVPLSATVPRRIRNTSTPASMAANRIPPRVDTPVRVGVSGLTIPMSNVELSIDGAGGGNGDLTIDGSATKSINAGTTVNLRGTTQTAPGNAGALRLVATQGGVQLAASTGFSVAAIIEDVSISFNSAVAGARRGVVVDTTWNSDSGTRADLDEVEFSEQVQYSAGTGVLAGAGAGAQNSGYLPATSAPLTDTHGTPVSFLTGPGGITAEQTFIFKDARTGAADIPTRNSGFRITRDVVEAPPGTVTITTSKAGASTSANGHASGAGAGAVSRTQAA